MVSVLVHLFSLAAAAAAAVSFNANGLKIAQDRSLIYIIFNSLLRLCGRFVLCHFLIARRGHSPSGAVPNDGGGGSSGAAETADYGLRIARKRKDYERKTKF